MLVTPFALLLVLVLLFGYGAARAHDRDARLLARLESARKSHPADSYKPWLLTGLPDPVRRYLAAALRANVSCVSRVVVSQSGTMRMKQGDRRQRRFRADQSFTMDPPGFVWGARIAMAPGMTAFVNDSYITGEGRLDVTLFGWFSVAAASGTPEMARGELLRYLAECVWFPTALLPGRGVTWEAIDQNSARAAIHDGRVTAELDFEFGADGLVESISTKARGRDVDGKSVPTPWRGRFTDYVWRHGMRIPLQGEAQWDLLEGPWIYWSGRLTNVVYDRAALSPASLVR